MRRLICIFSALIIFFVCGLFGLLVYCADQISENYLCFDDECPKGNISYINFLKSDDRCNEKYLPVDKNFFSFVNNKEFTAFLFRLIPVKNLVMQNLGEKIFVRPCGIPFGLKIDTDGLIVLGLKQIKTSDGVKFPACESKLKKGDILVSVDGCQVNSNDQFRSLIQKSEGKTLNLKIKRDSEYFETKLTPVWSEVEKKWMSGIIVRDSSAGLGTLTFSTKSGYFGGLGHAVYDIDTGDSLLVKSGEIVEASIYDVVKGSASKPGELCGDLKTSEPIGRIEINTDCGLYGVLDKSVESHDFVPVGLRHEAKEGKAYIYCTVDKEPSKKYEVLIESIDYKQDYKNFVLKIVDEELLKKTGGIVQGMSGTPIIQNGKLVGAITHVFLSDPTKGYGVFAETMIMSLQEIAKYKNFGF